MFDPEPWNRQRTEQRRALLVACLRWRAGALPEDPSCDKQATFARAIDRFEKVADTVGRSARQDFLSLCRAVQNPEPMRDALNDWALRLEQQAAVGLLRNSTDRLPQLDGAGQPIVDEEGYLAHRGKEKRLVRLKPLHVNEHVADLAINDANSLLRDHFRQAHADSAARRAFIDALPQQTWREGPTTQSMALEIVRHAAESEDLSLRLVVFNVVRMRFDDPRGRDSTDWNSSGSGGRGAGGCMLTVETLIVCKEGVVRVLDEPLRHRSETDPEPNPPVLGVGAQLDRVAQRIREALCAVDRTLVESCNRPIRQVAAIGTVLPLGRSRDADDARPGRDPQPEVRSWFKDPDAYEHRAADRTNPRELLLPVFTEPSERLSRWTLVALAGEKATEFGESSNSLQDLEHEVGQTGRRMAFLSPRRVSRILPWAASGPAIQTPEELAQALRDGAECALASSRPSDYPPRSAGHHIMYRKDSDKPKRRASMHGLLAHAAAERIEAWKAGL
jgi:hypothetical protein